LWYHNTARLPNADNISGRFGDFGVAMSWRFCRGNTAEPAADYHDARLIVTRLRRGE
jgi:hypothetical protein